MSRQRTTTTQRTVTAFDTGVGPVAAARDDSWVTTGRAARELGLRRTEFDLAVRLGRVRTGPGRAPGERRVARAEIERLRAGPDFPEALRRSVHAVGTAEGAELLGVAKSRFTRLARLGLLVPVAFHLNRYRAVVWLYLADELRLFGDDGKHAALLTGRMPEGLRGLLDSGIDLRPRNWRGRHLGFLLREAEDPWARAGAVASFLDPLHVARVVRDPYDRSHLNTFRRRPPGGANPDSPGARIAADLTTARDDDEIAWLRADLARLVDEARAHRPAPRPSASCRATSASEPLASRRPVLAPPPARPAASARPDTPAAADHARRRGLLARWRHRTARTATRP
ncbi:DUF6397 family protein [Streptomyces sp. HNS054]|uniref:DUF6397 family protein n=1 Tax=Streptomyces sp. HNS054 TaxID=1662446 RepID=UPI000652BE7C|nr:DUF6397 family protein [Streptomyces sp. HNS054]WPW17954.1 DUF6397 family protein [Streptomyces griseoincarnatus]